MIMIRVIIIMHVYLTDDKFIYVGVPVLINTQAGVKLKSDIK